MRWLRHGTWLRIRPSTHLGELWLAENCDPVLICFDWMFLGDRDVSGLQIYHCETLPEWLQIKMLVCPRRAGFPGGCQEVTACYELFTSWSPKHVNLFGNGLKWSTPNWWFQVPRMTIHDQSLLFQNQGDSQLSFEERMAPWMWRGRSPEFVTLENIETLWLIQICPAGIQYQSLTYMKLRSSWCLHHLTWGIDGHVQELSPKSSKIMAIMGG